MAEKSVPIIYGDPSKGPASFTRFVLPFAYKLRHKENLSIDEYFTEIRCDERLLERRKYFTHETDQVLFKRAKWFQLKSPLESKEFEPNFLSRWNFRKEEFPQPKDIEKLRAAVISSITEGKFDNSIDPLDCLNHLLGSLSFYQSFLNGRTVPEKAHKLHSIVKKYTELENREQKTIIRHFNRILIEELCDSVFCPKSLPIKVCIAPPQLVLFECLAEHKDDNADILKTGFLVIEVFFSGDAQRHISLDEMLELNEQFKYWQRPYEDHAEKKGYRQFLQTLPVSFGSDKTIGECDEQTTDDIYFDRWESLIKIPVQIGGKFYHLLDFMKDEGNAKDVAIELEPESNKWTIYADNRTFVWTCALTANGGNDLIQAYAPLKNKAVDFGHWIKLLNVDMPGESPQETHKITDFEKTWAKERTYERWEHVGTFYGFCYHGGAMLAGPWREPPLWEHFGGIYFDQVLLLLYVRVSLFRFSMKLNKISEEALEKKNGTTKARSQWIDDFQELRWTFVLFANLYQFPLLSNQQQGLEMYVLARRGMDVDDFFNEIEKEINSSHEYLAIEEARKEADRTGRLTVFASFGLLFSLVFAFLGMNIIIDDWKVIVTDIFNPINWNLEHIGEWLMLLATTLVFYISFRQIIKYSDRLIIWMDKLIIRDNSVKRRRPK